MTESSDTLPQGHGPSVSPSAFRGSDCLPYSRLESLAACSQEPTADEHAHLGECLSCRTFIVLQVCDAAVHGHALFGEREWLRATGRHPSWPALVRHARKLGEPRSRTAPSALHRVAVAVVLLATLGAILLLRQSEPVRVDPSGAFYRARARLATGEPPASEDVALLEQYVPDASIRRVFLDAPDPDELSRYGAWDGSTYRSGTSAVDLIAPRAATTETSPLFRYAVLDGDLSIGAATRMEFFLIDEGGIELSRQAIPGVHPHGPAELRLSDGLLLRPGRRYRWSIETRSSPRESVQEAWATFAVVDRIALLRLLESLEPTGREHLDRLLRACAMLSLDLATAATEELGELPEDLSVEEARHHVLLELRAQALLGDTDRAAELAEVYRSLGGS